ncbi:type I toxin-antitoxin system toxin Ldr family protein, partial [Escherichia coli]|nr:small toxic polypeptide LdrA/LdrC [Escherichia coli]
GITTAAIVGWWRNRK